MRAFFAQYAKQTALFLGVSLVVLLPLLKPGFVLNVDLVFTPHITVPAISSPSYAWWLLLKVLSFVLPVQIIEKLVLLAIVFLAGLGMYLWLEKLLVDANKAATPGQKAGFYIAGLLYAINPFCYSRFMTGQYLILLGYALLPFFAKSLYHGLWLKNKRQAWRPALWLAVISVISLHMAPIACLLGVAIVTIFMLENKNSLKQIGMFLLVFVSIWAVIDSVWLVPMLFGKSQTLQIISGFTNNDTAAFATNTEHGGALLNVFLMHGMWADAKNLFVAPQNVYRWWWLPCLAVVGIVLFGFYKLKMLKPNRTYVFLVLCVLALLLATGTKAIVIGPFNAWLFNHVPLFFGFREPQKFVSIVLFIYCIGFAVGSQKLYEYLQKASSDIRNAVLLVMVTTVILVAPLMPFGFRGQLKTSTYPKDWSKANAYFVGKNHPKAVFLPWHLYMPYTFTGRVIASPAPKFFTNAEVIASQNPEIGKARGYATSDIYASIESAIQTPGNVAPKLAGVGVSYVIVAKDYDYKKFLHIVDGPGFVKVLDMSDIAMYKVVKE